MKTKIYMNIVLSAVVGLTIETAAMDLNGDGVINADDSKKFLELITSGSALDPALDLNGDSKIDLHDALLYGQWVNGLYHSTTCPELFMSNPQDTTAFSNYAKTVVQTKKTFTKTALLDAYPDNTVRTDLNYKANDVAYVNKLDSMLRNPSGDTVAFNAFMKAVLQKGMGISTSQQYPNFLSALDAIHSKDMPLIFTTDALLYAMYRSYDNILMTLETNRFNAMLDSILRSSLDYCIKYYGSEDYVKDVQDYLSTALFLLNPPSRSDIVKSSQVSSNLSNIQSEQMIPILLFGRPVTVDFSQFKPRGHYDNSELLKQYFKAMMWLSRADLSFSIAGKGASARMKKASLVLWDCVVNSGSFPKWLEFNSVIELMVGTSDGMSIRGVGSLVKDLGIRNVKDYLSAFNESKFDSVVSKNKDGIQMILSQAKSYDRPQDSLDLDKIVSFMPQRFIIDSYTFSQVVYPLIDYRGLPSSLDIAFTLGDNSALGDDTDLVIDGLPGVLNCQRKLYDQLSTSGYQANLYMSWINSLRQLNGAENNAKISPVFRTAAWRMKMRNTQLMSWAHLRHNTILYAKQSYTGSITCTYPKAYIEPYPKFFQAIADYAAKGKKFFTTYDQSVAAYFDNLEQTSKKLKTAADYCASGQPLSTDLENWLKGCISSTSQMAGCTSVKIFDGWYKDLFFVSNISTANESNRLDGESSFFPTIADVHTKPADMMGPAEVLHAATGNVNLMAVVIEADTCPMVFVGPVGSYYDVITTDPSNPKRLTDNDWKDTISRSTATVSRPKWMNQILFK